MAAGIKVMVFSGCTDIFLLSNVLLAFSTFLAFIVGESLDFIYRQISSASPLLKSGSIVGDLGAEYEIGA